MGLLFSIVAFAAFVSASLVTYRLWRQQKRPDHGLRRAFVAASFLISVFLFHGMLRELMPRPIPARAGGRPASARGPDVMAKLGCGDCHSVGGGVVVGPDLGQAAAKYDHQTLVKWIEDPQAIYAARHKHPLNRGFPEMPNLEVKTEDAEAIADYLASIPAAAR